ncbi:hypothetical protein EDB87DRAFT_1695437 [Lactarius vividus]|nr:hypothetical protein EDB87DRAFT_1695437 [Lactarius vividus]
MQGSNSGQLLCILLGLGPPMNRATHLFVTFGPLTRPDTPPRDSSPVQFVAWNPVNPRHTLDADAVAAEEAEARERLWKFHQDHALHLRAAILATQYMFPQDPPQGPED